MVRLHLGRVADRVNRLAKGRNWAFVKVTPRSYVLVTWRTSGCTFRHVIVAAHSKTSAIDESSAPFQCCSRMPQQRSIGLYLLWYGGRYTSSTATLWRSTNSTSRLMNCVRQLATSGP